MFTTKGLNAIISRSIYDFFRRPYHGKSKLIAAVRDLVISKPQEVTHCFYLKKNNVCVLGQRTKDIKDLRYALGDVVDSAKVFRKKEMQDAHQVKKGLNLN